MNEKARTIVFNISALLLLAGAGLYLALPVAAASEKNSRFAVCHDGTGL